MKSGLWRELDARRAGSRDLRLEHVVDRHPPAGRGGLEGASRPVRRHALLQSGAGDAAHRAHPRPRHRRRDRGGHPRAVGRARQAGHRLGRSARASSSTGSSCRSSPRRCGRSRRASGPPRTSTPARGSASTTRWARSSWPTSSAWTSASGSCASSTTASARSTCARRGVLVELVNDGHLGQKTGRGFYTYPREPK